MENETDKKYNEMYTREQIKPEVILEIRKLIKLGFFKKEIDEKKVMLQQFCNELCKLNNIGNIDIEYASEDFLGCGVYIPDFNKIILNKPSLVTFLHEFYHYYATQLSLINDEENAVGWSISAYYLATPILCTSAINKGLIINQKVI